jgi:hypothetical protein
VRLSSYVRYSVYVPWNCIKIKPTFIFANKLTERTFYFSRSEPVIKSHDDYSYIAPNIIDFWTLSIV